MWARILWSLMVPTHCHLLKLNKFSLLRRHNSREKQRPYLSQQNKRSLRLLKWLNQHLCHKCLCKRLKRLNQNPWKKLRWLLQNQPKSMVKILSTMVLKKPEKRNFTKMQ